MYSLHLTLQERILACFMPVMLLCAIVLDVALCTSMKTQVGHAGPLASTQWTELLGTSLADQEASCTAAVGPSASTTVEQCQDLTATCMPLRFKLG